MRRRIFLSNGILTLLNVDVDVGCLAKAQSWSKIIMQRIREEKMGWKKYVYGLIGLYIIFDIVLVATMKERGSIDPTSWESILSEFGVAAAMIFFGLDAVLAPGDMLEWLRRHLHWSPPTGSFRLFGCLFLIRWYTFLGVQRTGYSYCSRHCFLSISLLARPSASQVEAIQTPPDRKRLPVVPTLERVRPQHLRPPPLIWLTWVVGPAWLRHSWLCLSPHLRSCLWLHP